MGKHVSDIHFVLVGGFLTLEQGFLQKVIFDRTQVLALASLLAHWKSERNTPEGSNSCYENTFKHGTHDYEEL